MSPASPRKTLLVIFAGAMSITSLLMSFITGWRLSDSIAAVEHSRKLRTDWERMMSLVKDAESGKRGFQITGDESYLEPYNAAVNQLPGVLNKLAQLIKEEEGPATALDLARGLVQARMNELKEAIAVRRLEGAEAGRRYMLTNKEKILMDDLREWVLACNDELDRDVAGRTSIMREDLKWGNRSALAAGFVALGAGLVALLLYRESLRQLRRESRLTIAKQRAEEADRQKSAFLATMSHEIRTPMNAILGFGELLEGEVQSDKEKQHVQAILAGGRSLLQIINDILDISKIEAGMMSVNPEPADLAELAQFLRQLFDAQAARQGVEMRVVISAALPRSLLIDSTHLRQILLNVVGNALKFTDHGHVAVHFGGRQGANNLSGWDLVIEVEDTGVGIPEEELTDIFKPFVQAQSRRSAAQKGTGLGLTIARRLTELMGGAVSIHSKPGKGTLVRLEFPATEISARLPQTTSEVEPAVDFNELRPSTLVVADDNETNRHLVLGIFENTHHTVRVASDGREAVDSILTDRPDVVLMDIRMPGMDGPEALKALRAQPGLEKLPVIAVTASSLSSEETGLRRNFDGYVRKPFSRADLFRELAQFIPRVELSSRTEDALAAAAAPIDPETAGRWREFVSGLRDVERNVWPRVRDGMALSDIAQFACQLRRKAEAARCPPFLAYADRLAAQGEAFAIDDLEKTLASFPFLIAKIESLAASATTP